MMVENIIKFSVKWLTNSMFCAVSFIPFFIVWGLLAQLLSKILNVNILGDVGFLVIFTFGLAPIIFAFIYGLFCTLLGVFFKKIIFLGSYTLEEVMVLLYFPFFLIIGNILCSFSLCYI